MVNDKGEYLFTRRPEEGLLGGLWELPNVPTTRKASNQEAAQRFAELLGTTPRETRYAGTVTHVFTHFRQRLHIYRVAVSRDLTLGRNYRFAVPSKLPLTTATRKALRLGPSARQSARQES